MRWAAAAALVLAGAVACAKPRPVTLGGEWPAAAGDYKDVTAAWTRHGILRDNFQQVLDLHATFRSPEWRAAQAAREARMRRLADGPRDELMAAARKAADGDYEVALVVVTYDRSENDLHRGERSVWRMALVDDAGVETAPKTIVRDRRPLDVLRAELPDVTEFSIVYVATFPRTAAVLHDGARQVALKMWSQRGAVELDWRAAAR